MDNILNYKSDEEAEKEEEEGELVDNEDENEDESKLTSDSTIFLKPEKEPSHKHHKNKSSRHNRHALIVSNKHRNERYSNKHRERQSEITSSNQHEGIPSYFGPKIIAFSAKLNDDLYHSTPGDVIVFNSVSMNYGNSYDSTTGIFTCPAKGLYMFMWNVAARSGKRAILAFKINGFLKRRTSAARKLDHYNEGVFKLKVDDQCWISYSRGDGYISKKFTKFGCIRITE